MEEIKTLTFGVQGLNSVQKKQIKELNKIHENNGDDDSSNEHSNKKNIFLTVLTTMEWITRYMINYFNSTTIVHDNIYNNSLLLIIKTVVFTEPIGFWSNVFLFPHFGR